MNPRPWTPLEDEALIAAREGGASLNQLALMIPGRSRGSCERRLRMLGIRAKHASQLVLKPAPKPAPQIDIPAGATLAEVQALFGRDAVENMLKSRGYRERDGRYYPGDNVMQVEERFYQYRVSAPPQGCFKCGCRVCACGMAQAA